MQHLVVDEIFHRITRHLRTIKDPADDDRIVRRIVVSQAVAGMIAAPGHLRPRHQPVEEARIKIIKYLLEMIISAGGTMDALASPHLANQVHLTGHGVTPRKFAKAGRVKAVNFFTVQFGNQDVQDGMKHRLRRSFEQVGEANQQFSVTQADGIVQVGEREEPNLKFRQRRSRAELSVGLFEDVGGSHCFSD